ncbi:MAG TPA: LysR family transcriptional regulator [Nitrospirota bacterium]|nr:LysR family transcriptional regulator [Nitrospirota bacterium]
MEDHRLKSYCLVVETKSFSRAAQAKHITQSAMSRLVKTLENELGVQLLHRAGKAVVPTPEGRHFYEQAKKILAEYAKIEQDLLAATGEAKALLRLGANTVPALYLLPQVMYTFAKTQAGIRIDLSVSRTENVLRDLRDKRIDLGIIDEIVTDQGVSAEAVTEDEIVVIAPEDHHLARKKAVTVQHLSFETFILPERGTGTREQIDMFLHDAGLDVRRLKIGMTLGSPELIVQMVEAGLGIAFASKWSVFKAVKAGTVKQLRLSGKTMKRHFYLISMASEGVAKPNVATTFREFLKQYRFFVPF